MYCKYCGKAISDDSRFCEFCGRQLYTKTSVSNIDEHFNAERQLVSEANNKTTASDEKIKRTVKKILKELLVLLTFLFVAFIGRFATYHACLLTPIPEVTEEDQRAFNDTIFARTYPEWAKEWAKDKGKYISDFISGKFDYSTTPIPAEISFGDVAGEYLKLGSFKYDSNIHSESQLENITESRRAILDSHSEDSANIVFWIILIGLSLLRYIYLFICWIKPKQ